MTHRPFNLDEAKAGAPIQTRDGRPAKFIAHVPEARTYTISALADGWLCCYREDGRSSTSMADSDIVMAPRKRTVWVNVYEFGNASVYKTREEADMFGAPSRIGNRAWPLEIEE